MPLTRHVSDIDGVAVFSNGILNAGFVGAFRGHWRHLYIDWPDLVVLLPIPVLLVATRIFQKHIKGVLDVRNQVAKINEPSKSMTGMHIVQAFNRERSKMRLLQTSTVHREANIRSIWAFSVFFPVGDAECHWGLLLYARLSSKG